jgi:hypothetical protein
MQIIDIFTKHTHALILALKRLFMNVVKIEWIRTRVIDLPRYPEFVFYTISNKFCLLHIGMVYYELPSYQVLKHINQLQTEIEEIDLHLGYINPALSNIGKYSYSKALAIQDQLKLNNCLSSSRGLKDDFLYLPLINDGIYRVEGIDMHCEPLFAVKMESNNMEVNKK